MAQHRGYTRKKFIDAVGDDHMQRYFVDHVGLESANGELSETVVTEIIESQDDVVQNNIDEELLCINDVAEKGMDYLNKASRDFEIPLDDEWPRERVAMNLFLDYPAAFQSAYDWYLYRTSANSLSHHQFEDVAPDFDCERIEEFRGSVETWYGDQSKGKLCDVRHYLDKGTHVLIVAHGDYPQARTVWDNGEVRTSIYRPAKEDVLRFTPDNSVLSVKLSSRKNAQREHYIRSFAGAILRVDDVPQDTLTSTTVSLEPIRTGQFDNCQWGKGEIEWVQLVGIEIEFENLKARASLSSPDVLETVRDNLKDLDPRNGKLRFAKRQVPIELRRSASSSNTGGDPTTTEDSLQSQARFRHHRSALARKRSASCLSHCWLFF